MAVYPNGRSAVRNPGRYFGVAPGLDLYARGRGDSLNRFVSDVWSNITGSAPTGYGLAGTVPPVKSGGLSSATRLATVSSVADGVMGVLIFGDVSIFVSGAPADRLPIDDMTQVMAGSAAIYVSTNEPRALPLDDTPQMMDGTTSVLFVGADLLGEIIASGSGSCTITFTQSQPYLVASMSAAGSSTITIDAVSALIGAIADIDGQSSIYVTASSTSRLPINDSSPLRGGSASFVFSGLLVPYAIGQMSGSTATTTEVTPDTVARAVWAAVAAEFADAGTMGRKLNDLSGGVDGGGLTPEQSSALAGAHEEARLARQLAGNRVVVSDGDGGGKVITIYADDGVTPVRSMTLSSDGLVRGVM